MASINGRRVMAVETVTGRFPTTHEGAPARSITTEQALLRAVMSCLLWEDTYYEEGHTIATRLEMLVGSCRPEYVAEVAITAREVMNLRHVPLYLARLLIKQGSESRKVVGPLLERIIQRPDELTEFLAIYWKDGKTPLASQVKKGLARAFKKFSAYQLAKYNRDHAIKLRDVMFLTHPKPKDEVQATFWQQLANQQLAAPDTWEVALSAGADKRETFTRLLEEQKLGALALLKNLRGMTAAGVDETLIRSAILAAKTDRVLPFRYITAHRYAPRYQAELEQAMFKNCADLPKLAGRTILLVDTSGSMKDTVSKGSELRRIDAAAGLAMLLREMCERVAVVKFSNTPTLLNTELRGFALSDALGHPAGGTYTDDAKRFADQLGYDRVIILTDEQSHQAISNPLGRGYVINVASYRNGIGYGPWTHIDGWSEAVAQYIQYAETL